MSASEETNIETRQYFSKPCSPHTEHTWSSSIYCKFSCAVVKGVGNDKKEGNRKLHVWQHKEESTSVGDSWVLHYTDAAADVSHLFHSERSMKVHFLLKNKVSVFLQHSNKSHFEAGQFLSPYVHNVRRRRIFTSIFLFFVLAFVDFQKAIYIWRELFSWGWGDQRSRMWASYLLRTKKGEAQIKTMRLKRDVGHRDKQ